MRGRVIGGGLMIATHDHERRTVSVVRAPHATLGAAPAAEGPTARQRVEAAGTLAFAVMASSARRSAELDVCAV